MSQPTGIIVLDGCEHSGKTTLADYLARHFGALVLHHGYTRFKDKIFAYHTAGLRRAINESNKRLVVVDRLWMSEAVYGHVYRGGTKWPHQGRMFDRMLRRFGAVQVVCVTDPAHAMSIVRDLPGRDLYQDQAKAAQVAEHFLGLVNRVAPAHCHNYFFELQDQVSRPDIVHYDYRMWKIEDAVTWLLDLVSELRRDIIATALNPEMMNITGRLPGATVCMVGDKCNPKNSKVAWPFFEYGNCSLHLATAMAHARISESNLVWTNAHDPYCIFDLIPESCHFVALGRQAQTTLKHWAKERKIDKEIRFVRHPQSAKRFDSANIVGYGGELSAAVHRPLITA